MLSVLTCSFVFAYVQVKGNVDVAPVLAAIQQNKFQVDFAPVIDDVHGRRTNVECTPLLAAMVQVITQVDFAPSSMRSVATISRSRAELPYT